MDERQLVVRLDLDVGSRGARARGGDGAAQQVVDLAPVERRRGAAGLQARDVEQVGDETVEAIGLDADIVQQLDARPPRRAAPDRPATPPRRP